MNLGDYISRLLNEQKWREEQAQKLSSGLGSMPYNFQEQMNFRAPSLMRQFEKADEIDQTSDKIVNSLQNALGPKPNWFEDRFQLNNMIQKFYNNKQKLLQNPGI